MALNVARFIEKLVNTKWKTFVCARFRWIYANIISCVMAFSFWDSQFWIKVELFREFLHFEQRVLHIKFNMQPAK